jgi:hypothetical protein
MEAMSMVYNPENAPHRAGRSKEEWDDYRRNQALAHLLNEMRRPAIAPFERANRARALLSTAFRYLSPLEVAECEAIIRACSSSGNKPSGARTKVRTP